MLLEWISGREENERRNYFKINLHESMGPGKDRTHDPWIYSQTRICSQTRYRLRYAARYKSIGIFPNAQGQVTHKPLVASCWISNPSEILWVYLLPARMKKIQSKMNELEWSQHYSLIFKMLKGSQLQKVWWDLHEIQTHPSFNSCSYCMQEWGRSI